MFNKYKKFDKSLYQENDKKGKEFAVKVLKQLYPEHRIIEGSQFGVDLKVFDKDNNLVKNVEVEVRNNWKTDFDFPFDTVNIPERKRKFFDGNCLYVSVNKNCNRCLIIEDKIILKSPVVENPNKYVASNEYFFKVPIEKAKSVILQGGIDVR